MKLSTQNPSWHIKIYWPTSQKDKPNGWMKGLIICNFCNKFAGYLEWHKNYYCKNCRKDLRIKIF